MARTSKAGFKKNNLSKLHHKSRYSFSNDMHHSPSKKSIIHNLIHPDYILFDWEFFSTELEFE